MLYNKQNYRTWSWSTNVILKWHLWLALKCSGNKIWRMAMGIWSFGMYFMLFVRLGNTLEEPAASIIRVTFNLFYSVDGGSRFLWNACIFLPNCMMACHTDHSLHRIVKTEVADSSKMVVLNYLTSYTGKQTLPWKLQISHIYLNIHGTCKYIRALRYTSLKWKAVATIRL